LAMVGIIILLPLLVWGLVPSVRASLWLEIDGQLGWTNATDVVAQDRDTAAVSFFTQALEDLLRAIGVRIQQSRDAPLEGVEEAAARGWAGPLETGSCQPLGDGLAVKTERASNLGDG